jgi:Arc/MetJ-type ribon-helix-helix transcriptional regulator
MSKQTHLNMLLPEPMARGIKHLIEAGEFASQAEYICYLIRTDLSQRLATVEQDKIILERLEEAKNGGPFVNHEDVVEYMQARIRGEKPQEPKTFYTK